MNTPRSVCSRTCVLQDPPVCSRTPRSVCSRTCFRWGLRTGAYSSGWMVIFFVILMIGRSELCFRTSSRSSITTKAIDACRPCQRRSGAHSRTSVSLEDNLDDLYDLYDAYDLDADDTSLFSRLPFFSSLYKTSTPCCPERPGNILDRSSRLANNSDCGLRGRESFFRSVTGAGIATNSLPWMCALLHADNSWLGCGATLLNCNPVVIITAAHCVDEIGDPSSLRVACGAFNLGRPGPSPLDDSEVRLQVSEIVVHSGYRSFRINSGLEIHRYVHDIAVLKTENSLPCSKRVIYPACLPSKDETYVGWPRSIVSGWGHTGPGQASSSTLRKVAVPIVSEEKCNREICAFNIFWMDFGLRMCQIADSQLCAGGSDGRGACKGDSGGGLVAKDVESSRWSLVGVVSWGRGCAQAVTVFTRVSHYLTWIARQYDLVPPP